MSRTLGIARPQGSHSGSFANSAEQPAVQLPGHQIDHYFWMLAERETCMAQEFVVDYADDETFDANEQASLRKLAQFVERTDATEDYDQYLRPYPAAILPQDHSDSIKLSIRFVFTLWLRRREWLRSCHEIERSGRKLLRHEIDQILTTWRYEYESSEEQLNLIAVNTSDAEKSPTACKPIRKSKRSRFAAHRNRLACNLQMSRMWLTSPYFDWNTLKELVSMANQC
jgi:hypothetical protein